MEKSQVTILSALLLFFAGLSLALGLLLAIASFTVDAPEAFIPGFVFALIVSPVLLASALYIRAGHRRADRNRKAILGLAKSRRYRLTAMDVVLNTDVREDDAVRILESMTAAGISVCLVNRQGIKVYDFATIRASEDVKDLTED
jgi:phosphotransferase system  glucose/maltose/N-acetylglucosamine-specific IIC component